MKNNEMKGFFYATIADYYRYACEINKEDESFKKGAKEAYQRADYYIMLSPDEGGKEEGDRDRLQFMLQQSIFMKEIMNDSNAASNIASNAQQEGMIELSDAVMEGNNTWIEATMEIRSLNDRNIERWA